MSVRFFRSAVVFLCIFSTDSGVSAQVATSWAVCYTENGDSDKRIAACTKEIEGGKLDSISLPLAYTKRGRAYVDKKQPDKALADFTRAIELEPGMGPAYFSRAKLHAAAGRKSEAIADFRMVLRGNPRDSETLEALKALGVEAPALPPPSGGGGGGGGPFGPLF
mgnify:CR=1 FL=1